MLEMSPKNLVAKPLLQMLSLFIFECFLSGGLRSINVLKTYFKNHVYLQPFTQENACGLSMTISASVTVELL